MRIFTVFILFGLISTFTFAQRAKGSYQKDDGQVLSTLFTPRNNWDKKREFKELEMQMMLNNSNKSSVTAQLMELISQYPCTSALGLVEERGQLVKSLSSYEMPGTSWLKSVKFYNMDDIYFAVAEIVTDRTGLITQKYVYCNLSLYSWNAFIRPEIGIGRLTHGERFNDYIIDYKCNCQ